VKTYVVHGEPEAAAALAKLIKETLKWNVEIPAHGALAKLS
jgi:hypothetical protein